MKEGQIKVIAMNENGTIYNDSISTAFRYDMQRVIVKREVSSLLGVM